MPGTDDYPLNHDTLSGASLKIQALLRGRHDRSLARKKRASLVLDKESDEGTESVRGCWVEAWDPHYHCNYYYNMDTEETTWDPPAGWDPTTATTTSTTTATTDNGNENNNDNNNENENENGYGRGRTAPDEPTLDHIERTASGPTRHNAATKIQSQARARMARRELAAMKEVERIGHLRRGGLPPNEDFRQAGKKLRSEIKQSRRLVAMKEKRIEQLEQGMDDRKVEADLRRAEMSSLQKKLDDEREEVKLLEKRLHEKNVSATDLKKLVQEKDSQMETMRKEKIEMNESLEQAKKMLKRRDHEINRKDQQISNMMPDTEEVCLSARSFSENMMINLRDQAIDAKEQQLDLLNRQNEGLNENITRVETEVEKVQKDLLAKDNEITIKRKKITHLTNNIDRLERELQKKGGEEAAIELTNKQNSNLLVLLQQHEAKTEALEEVRTELEEALEQLRVRHEILMKTSAEFEAQTMTLQSSVDKYKREATTGLLEWTGLKAQLTVELDETKRVARVRIDAMQEELRTRREKQYATLSRLQAADESLRKSQDDTERLRETASVIQERLFQMEAETVTLNTMHQDALNAERERTNQVQVRLDYSRANTAKEKDGQVGLKKQLQEMAATILKLVDKNNEEQLKKDEIGQDILERDSEMKTLEERVANLIQETSVEGKARVRAETTAEVMSTQLDALRRENSLMHAAVTQSAEDWEARNLGLKKRLGRTKSRLSSETVARRNAMERYIRDQIDLIPTDDFGEVVTSSKYTGGDLSKKTKHIKYGDVLNLSNLALTDSEIIIISNLFGKKSQLSHRYRTLDLSYNRITDDGIRELTKMLPAGTFLEYINLSGNMMSGDGARMLADIANQCTSMGVRHVYIHQDAKIQALGTRPKRWRFHAGSHEEVDADTSVTPQHQSEMSEELKREFAGEEGKNEAPSASVPSVLSPPRPEGETGTVITFDCRNNEPPTDDDLNGGLSSVISTTGVLGALGSGSSSVLVSRSTLGRVKGGSTLSSASNSARNEAARNRRLEKAYLGKTDNNNDHHHRLRNNSSILSAGSSSVLLSEGSVESQAAATAGNLARRSNKNIKFSDRRDNSLYRDIRKSKSGKSGKKGMHGGEGGGGSSSGGAVQSLPNLHVVN